ncbi:MAG: FtsQ-type POTRA domain-containing protein [bacterium]|nr:FtsQ-type POTRA domain-containing protein [bacterium]
MFGSRKKNYKILDIQSAGRKKIRRTLSSNIKGPAPVLIIFPLLLFVITGVVLFFKSYIMTEAYFNIRKVVISNNHFYSKKDIIEAADIKNGQNIFSVELKEIAGNIESLPNIAAARVTRRIPDTVFVKVYEREAVAQVESGRFYLVDEEGFVLEPVYNVRKDDIPVIKGREIAGLVPGSKINDPQICTAIKLISHTLDVMVRAYVNPRDVDISDDTEIRMVINKGVVTRFQRKNFDQNMEKLVNRLVKIVQDSVQKNKTVESIDMRFDRVPVKFKEKGA